MVITVKEEYKLLQMVPYMNVPHEKTYEEWHNVKQSARKEFLKEHSCKRQLIQALHFIKKH